MTIQEAFEKSIEGGYKNDFLLTMEAMEGPIAHDHIFLDPQFWSYLGKSLEIDGKGIDVGNGQTDFANFWKKMWHLLIDALIEGKTPEEFFLTLK